MFVCDTCGKLIEDCEIQMGTQCHGYTSIGQPLNENVVMPCSCGGDFVPATKCAICGTHFDNSELNGVCEGCLEEYETVHNALEMGKECMEDVTINGFIASVLDKDQIDKILTKWVEENFVDHSMPVIRFCEEDEFFFSDWIRLSIERKKLNGEASQ